jgi:hypothetical protein
MKTLKSLVVAALMCGYFTNCQNAAPTPEPTNVVVTPPTPVIPTPNKCDSIKNPLEDVDWLKEYVVYFKSSKEIGTITQYTYKGKPVYHVISSQCSSVSNCDKSIKGIYDCAGVTPPTKEQATTYIEVMQNASNPVLLFEKK